jgi:ribosomal protein S18 acetylase RimI-like enzyme
MNVRDVQPQEVEQVRQFLAAHGWAHRVGSVEHFVALMAGSQRTAVAVHGQAVVGFARAITDGLSNGYISMVVVAPQHRRQGIGRALVQHVVRGSPSITWMLRAERGGATGFFAKLGFVASTVAMEKARTQNGA